MVESATLYSRPKANAARRASVATSYSQPLAAPKSSKTRSEGKNRQRHDGSTTSDRSGGEAPTPKAEAGNTTSTSTLVGTKKRKAGKTQMQAPAVIEPEETAEEEDQTDNKEWARQLASLKKGTSLAPPVTRDSRGRTVRQSTVNGMSSLSSASSNTGGDADDDLSPVLSPSLAAGDVSDMLEAPSAGPSVLRLTDPLNPQKTKQQRQATTAQAQETKKQRQNRKKVEEKKAIREQEEKERRVLLEKQLHTAREARGEPARNGVVSAKPPATSAWALNTASRVMGSTPTNNVTAATAQAAPLLDTFEDAESTASSNGNVANTTAATSPTINYEQDLPSVEEQLQMIHEENQANGWNTVAKGRKQKKKAINGIPETTHEGHGDVAIPSSAPRMSQKLESAKIVAKPSTTITNGFSTLEDSDWAA
ncbi:hypothetical protein LTR50_000175 [Elasticomyces elasticus]|nr:hypothetical protein LTR50_000175 [Elasticomyces elasticus]